MVVVGRRVLSRGRLGDKVCMTWVTDETVKKFGGAVLYVSLTNWPGNKGLFRRLNLFSAKDLEQELWAKLCAGSPKKTRSEVQNQVNHYVANMLRDASRKCRAFDDSTMYSDQVVY